MKGNMEHVLKNTYMYIKWLLERWHFIDSGRPPLRIV
jgi:hypothetical protein